MFASYQEVIRSDAGVEAHKRVIIRTLLQKPHKKDYCSHNLNSNDSTNTRREINPTAACKQASMLQ